MAAEGDMHRVRGTIEQASPTSMTVKSRDGTDVTITLASPLRLTGVKAASSADIKIGDFVGVASIATADGGSGALEVVIFPAAMKGAGQGSFPWDLEPNSTMTNATVTNAVENVDGRSLTLTYPEGSKSITLPEGIPVVTLAQATATDLVVGAPVFVSTTEGAGGALTAGNVVVGSNGVAPPM
jgi:hypothetical protein